VAKFAYRKLVYMQIIRVQKACFTSWISMSPFIYMRFETVPKELASSSWAERVAQEPIMLESYINSNKLRLPQFYSRKHSFLYWSHQMVTLFICKIFMPPQGETRYILKWNLNIPYDTTKDRGNSCHKHGIFRRASSMYLLSAASRSAWYPWTWPANMMLVLVYIFRIYIFSNNKLRQITHLNFLLYLVVITILLY
jgi:hypothetical protein